MSLTRPATRLLVYKRGFGMGFARTATAIAAGNAVTDAVAFTDTNAAEGQYVGTYIYRPLAAAANQIRQAGVVSGSTLTFGGLAYSGDTAVLGYEIVGLLHPDEFNEAIRVALRRVYFETYAPLNVLWTDGDFISSSATTPYDWTAVASGTTVTKSATVANNDTGHYSLVLTSAGTTHSSSFYVEPGDIIVHGASGRVTATTTTGTYKLLDVTHTTTLETMAITSLSFQHFLRVTTIPPGCYEIQMQLQTAGSGTPVSVWDYSFGHPSGRESGQIPMPSWLTQKARLIDFGPAEYGRATGSLQYDARSRRWLSDQRVIDYQLYPMVEEANAYKLQVNRENGLEDRDYWIHGFRQESDIVELTDETSATNAREDHVMAAVLYEVADRLFFKTGEQKWLAMKAAAQVELNAQTQSERPAPGKREKTAYAPGSRV